MDRSQPRKITRNREFRACTECRRRKLKCDRQFPCVSCRRRNESEACTYERSSDIARDNSFVRASEAEARLVHLESLVKELSKSHHGSVDEELSISALPNAPVYSGPTHWGSMLEDIEELRDVITRQNEAADLDMNTSNEDDEMALLFGAGGRPSIQGVISESLPPRQEADQLTAAYFRAKAVAAPFIHASHFRRHYMAFWDNPLNASPLWTSMLFSILEISAKTVLAGAGAAKEGSTGTYSFAAAAAYCLNIGQYHKPQKFSVEALLLLIQSQCLSRLDVSPRLGILLGTLIRLATTMGYHRDPSSFNVTLSAFEAEMRRRTWSLCMQLDLLVSFLLGLPSNIQYPTWDTKPPTNLLDSDFDEYTTKMPEARPDAELTEITFYIAKHRLMTTFEKTLRHSMSTIEQPDCELEALELELQQTQATLPVALQSRPMSDSIVDPPYLIVTRLCVSLIYQKSLLVLHRKYVILGRQRSLQLCHETACDLVNQFIEVYREFEPGGQLSTERWFMGSITWNDFLLGCTSICLTMCSAAQVAHLESTSMVNIDTSASLSLLSKAQSICQQQSSRSISTARVEQLVQRIITKLNNPGLGSSFADPTQISAYPSYQAALTMPSQEFDTANQWQDDLSGLLGDAAWNYMEQFLDLPDE